MRKNKSLYLVLFVLALAGFLFISTGGEYFHHFAHHDADEAAHQDNCQFYQLLAQIFVLFILVLAALCLAQASFSSPGCFDFIQRIFLTSYYLRAPPAALA